MCHQHKFFITVMMKDDSNLATHLLLSKRYVCYTKGYRENLYSDNPNVSVLPILPFQHS